MSPVENILPCKVFPGIRKDVVYDINIAVLVHCAGGELSRVKCMQQFGLVNPGDLDIHITIIASLGDGCFVDELCHNWRASGDVTVLEMTSRHPVPKIHGYYFWLMASGLRARWHARVDDDSITDLASAIEFLDERFGDASVHVATGPVIPQEHQAIFVPYLLEKGIFLDQVHTEWESSFTTAAGMAQIFSDAGAHAMLAEIGSLFQAPGDRTLALAAHIAGVPVIENARSRWDFEIDRLTFFGGDLHHVHYVPWHNRDVVAAIAAFLAPEGPRIERPAFEQLFETPLHIYLKPRTAVIITLFKNGLIAGGREVAADQWEFRENELLFKDFLGVPVMRFTTLVQGANQPVMRGECLRTGEIRVVGALLLPISRQLPHQMEGRKVSMMVAPKRALYVRVGYDHRILSFSEDGTIVEGSAPFERRWRLRRHKFETVFEILGDGGVLCTLSEHEDGIWRGYMNFGEAARVVVIPVKS
jgi:hypothetical protein